METTVTTNGNVMEVKVSGRLDTMTAPEFDNEMKAHVSSHSNEDILIDCGELEYVSSAGLRSFITLLKGCKARGCELTLRNMPASLRTIFDMTGFTSIFNII